MQVDRVRQLAELQVVDWQNFATANELALNKSRTPVKNAGHRAYWPLGSQQPVTGGPGDHIIVERVRARGLNLILDIRQVAHLGNLWEVGFDLTTQSDDEDLGLLQSLIFARVAELAGISNWKVYADDGRRIWLTL